MKIILQWTRGRGHHSFEDMHQPLLEGYVSVHSDVEFPNPAQDIALAVGSGLGNSK